LISWELLHLDGFEGVINFLLTLDYNLRYVRFQYYDASEDMVLLAGVHPGSLFGSHDKPLCTAGTQHKSR